MNNMIPVAGDIWQWKDELYDYRYLVLKVVKGGDDTYYCCSADLLCLENGDIKHLYPWPRERTRWLKLV